MEEQDPKLKPRITYGMVVLGVLLVLALAFVTTPVVMKSHKKAAMTSTTSNAKQVFYLLIEFDQDYGEFPGDATAILHTGMGGEPIVDLRTCKGEYSNDYMGQFIAGGYTKSEQIFVAPWEKDPGRKADDDISSRSRILEAGECGFSYVKNQSTSDNSGRPVLLAPMSGEGVQFDPKPYDHKAVVLRIDGAVKQLLINKDTCKAKIGMGKTLFDGGADTVWGEEGFDVANLVHPRPWGKPLQPSMAARLMIGFLVVGIVFVFIRRRKKRHARG
ncbi:MAG: hypothetical protein H7A51_18400 [Akkermansiaceae bacterium]|nr:hypothetical protein [Akkermansiaceae bacterium]